MFLAGLIAGAVGLVLFVVELAVVLGGNTLGTLGAVLLWVGVGLLVAAGVLFLLAVLSASEHAADPAGSDSPGFAGSDSPGFAGSDSPGFAGSDSGAPADG